LSAQQESTCRARKKRCLVKIRYSNNWRLVTGSRFKNTVFDTRKTDYDGFVAMGRPWTAEDNARTA
jgi:hypothetical protein